jgi:ATP-binding cassette subfamily B protein
MASSSKEKVVDRDLIRRLYYFIHPFRYWLLLALVFTMFVSFLGPYRPKLVQEAIDVHIANRDLEGLGIIILKIAGVLFAESVLLVGNTYLTRWIGQGTLYRLRTSVFDKIQKLHVQYFDRNPLGRLVTRTTNDIEAIDQLVSAGVVNMIGDLFRIFFILYFMLSMDWQLSLVALSTLPVLIYSTYVFKKKVRVSFLNVRDQVSRINSFIQEHISGISIVQLFNREKKEYEKYKKINDEHRNAHIKTIFYFAIFWPAVEVLSSVGMALVIWYGGASALAGTVSLGVLVAFIQYVRQFFQPIRDLSEKFNTLQSAMAATERIFGVMDVESKIKNSENAIHLEKVRGDVSFENVWFKYNESEKDYILKDVSFDCNEGETTAIVGATGAGKTTIINLITRFYDIQKGKISLDGLNIHEVTLNSLRHNIGLVLQDNALFSGTVMENITLGNEDIDEQKVYEAAELVEADAFIKKLPGNYQYELAERGDSLSMGQRQLICFVRALVYDPQILILDEATSSVDSETEALVTKAANILMKGRTSIVIAHRLSTIVHADQILVMHKGEIRERGTHQDLLKIKDGIYRKLYELQYKDQAKKVLAS